MKVVFAGGECKGNNWQTLQSWNVQSSLARRFSLILRKNYFVGSKKNAKEVLDVIHLKAKVVVQKSGLPEGKFRGSKSWCYHFMERRGFSIRRRTTVVQKLPKDYENKLISFQRLVISKRKQHSFELKHIGNADQTPLTFDIVTNSTLAEKGIKSVPILTTGHDKDRFTVMLACLVCICQIQSGGHCSHWTLSVQLFLEGWRAYFNRLMSPSTSHSRIA